MRRYFLALLLICASAPALSAREPPTRSPADTLKELAASLWSCWRAPPDTQNFTVTVRLSLRRDGSVIGKPRVTFADFGGDPSEQGIIMSHIVEALEACTPVALTPALGGAIAGRMLTMTFSSPSTRA